MPYLLRKIEIENGKTSLIPKKYGTLARELHLFDFETEEREVDVGIENVKKGWQVILTNGPMSDIYHRTSKIKEIVSRNSDKEVTFRTQTSLYNLKKVV